MKYDAARYKLKRRFHFFVTVYIITRHHIAYREERYNTNISISILNVHVHRGIATSTRLREVLA